MYRVKFVYYYFIFIYYFYFLCMISKYAKENKCNKVNMQGIIPVRGPPPSQLEASSPRSLDEDSEAGTLFIFEFLYFPPCFILSSFEPKHASINKSLFKRVNISLVWFIIQSLYLASFRTMIKYSI
jgi:hypothetical protein